MNIAIVSEWSVTCSKWEQKQHSRSVALLYSSACLGCFPTANKCCLSKLAAIAVVQDITVLQYSHRLSNISQTINIVSVKMDPSWHFYFAPFLILPSPWTGTRREQGTRCPFSCPATDFRLDHLSFDSPDYVVLLCRLDGNWNFTSAVLLNTAAFILPLETASRNSCSQRNIQIFQRIFFSLTLKSPLCYLAVLNSRVSDRPPAIVNQTDLLDKGLHAFGTWDVRQSLYYMWQIVCAWRCEWEVCLSFDTCSINITVLASQPRRSQPHRAEVSQVAKRVKGSL